MNLPDPPENPSGLGFLRAWRQLIEMADRQNLKRGQVIDQLFLQSPDLSVWRGTIDDTGTLTWTKQTRA